MRSTRRRQFCFFGTSLVLLIGGALCLAESAEARQPNVIVILADDLGWGEFEGDEAGEIPTPHIESIAANGVRFPQGYVSGPYCSPTRAGLMTGRYQTRFGHEFNPGAGPGKGLPLDEKTFADYMRAAGYATAAIGKWHLGSEPEFYPTRRGFDEFYGTLNNSAYFHPPIVDSRKSTEPQRVESDEFYSTDAYAERAAEWIGEHKDEPFFLYLPFNSQHAPLQATAKYLERFQDIDDKKRQTFAAMLAAQDDGVGRVLDALKEHQLDEQTLVVYLTDNGGPTAQTTSNNLPLRGGKASTLEGGVRVPFYMQWKGKLPAGKTFDHPIIQLDLLPTALAAAGVAPLADAKLEGVNLLPYLTGEKTEPPHDALYWRFGTQWAIRQGDWKLVASRMDDLKPRLFNLASDIGEAKDLSKEEPERVKELQAAWDAWDKENVPPKWDRPDKSAKKKPAKAGAKKRGRKKAAKN
jgi:arylsulfatase A-like enzyme